MDSGEVVISDHRKARATIDALRSHATLKARITELEEALRITRLIIRNEMIENAVVDTQTMQSLGSMVDAALFHADGDQK